MKAISLIPKSWKKSKGPFHTRDSSIPILDLRADPFTPTSNSSSSVTLVDIPNQRKRSLSVDRVQDSSVIHISSSINYAKMTRPSTAPNGSSRRSHVQYAHQGPVRPRAPSDASQTILTTRTAETNSTVSLASPPRGPGISPTTAKFHAMDRYFSPVPSTGSRVVRVKKSMPELDGVWKGFLEDVHENVDSIRLDLELVNDARSPQTRPLSRDSETPHPRPLDTAPNSSVPASMNLTHTVSQARSRAGSQSSSDAHLPYHCTGNCCTFSRSESRKGSLIPSLSPVPASPNPGHERDISADFPLSLFPIPPPLNHTPTLKNRQLPDSSASIVFPPIQLVDVTSSAKTRSPPGSPARKQAPQPLEMRHLRLTVESPPSPILDSPPPSTPTTPRFSQSPPPSLRTASSVAALKKKTSGGPGGRPFASPLLPTPPTTPDHYGYTSSSPEPPDPYQSGRPFERPGLRPVYSSSQLRGYASPPPGAHRATMSESVHATGTPRAPPRPLVVSSTHGPLQGDAYLYPRPAPDPAAHVQWGYAV